MKNRFANLRLYWIVLLAAFPWLIFSSGGVPAAVATAPAGPALRARQLPPDRRLLALPRLLAAGSRGHLWMIVPSKPSQPGAGPQFLLLSHVINARHGNSPLWRQISMGAFTGYPLCAVAARNPANGAMHHGVYLFFQNASALCFGSKGSVRLPILAGEFSPVAAAYDNGNVYLLAYGFGVPQKTKNIISPGQQLLQRLGILESRMIGTSPPAAIPPLAQASGTNVPAGTAVTTQPAAKASGNKAPPPSAGVLTSTRSKIAAAKPAAARVSAKASVALAVPAWHLLVLHDNHWSMLPPPALSAHVSNLLVVGRTVMMVVDDRLIVFRLVGAHDLTGQSMDLRSGHLQWDTMTAVSLSHPAHGLLGAQMGHHGVLAWTSSGRGGQTDITGLLVGITENGSVRMTRWPGTLLSATVGSALSDVALGRDGDCFAIVMRQAGRKLTEYTFNQTGRLLQGPQSVVPLARTIDAPGEYERLILAALIVLLALSVWRRKEPFGALQITPNLQVARLYRRFAAAGIDLALAALVVMVIFHLYTRADWVKMAAASLDLLFNPQNLLKVPQFLWMLAIYELHVTVTELIFARSIGKWILGLTVVDMSGQRPGFVSLLTRNLFRVAEMVAVVVLVFMFVSTDRQRIGDIMARTVVVQNVATGEKTS